MPEFRNQLQQCLPDLWRYAYALTRDRHMADDLVQDCAERALRTLFPAPDIPIELPERPQAANTPRSPLRAIAASLAILGVGIALGWMGRGIAPQNTNLMVAGLVPEAITAHAVFTADAHRPVEIGADEEDLLIRWLSNRVGGRLLSVADGPAAQFMYENAAGTRITLFAVRSDNSQLAEFTFKQNGKANSFYWQDDRLRYAIVGDLPRDELSKLAIRVFEAFS